MTWSCSILTFSRPCCVYLARGAVGGTGKAIKYRSIMLACKPTPKNNNKIIPMRTSTWAQWPDNVKECKRPAPWFLVFFRSCMSKRMGVWVARWSTPVSHLQVWVNDTLFFFPFSMGELYAADICPLHEATLVEVYFYFAYSIHKLEGNRVF